jgi:SPP1 family predicted phage head-tail adaptor
MVLFFDPGQMTARLALETPRDVPDGQGGATTTWQEIAALWARIEPVSTVQAELASGEAGTITHRIWIRHRGDVQAGDRFRKGNRVMMIKLVHDPDETGRYLVCRCEEDAR